jgi:hypothetical protein
MYFLNYLSWVTLDMSDLSNTSDESLCCHHLIFKNRSPQLYLTPFDTPGPERKQEKHAVNSLSARPQIKPQRGEIFVAQGEHDSESALPWAKQQKR